MVARTRERTTDGEDDDPHIGTPLIDKMLEYLAK